MGESIAEGTIVRWIKKVGDTVDRDEPLFEISTDKVDAEIPSPAAGVLTEIKVREGETVPVNAVVGTIGAEGEVARGPASTAAGKAEAAASTQPQADGTPAPASVSETAGGPPAQAPSKSNGQRGPQPVRKEDLRRQKSSPLVRRIAKDHNIDLASLSGTGIGGRVTKNDILGYIEGIGDRGSGIGLPAEAPSTSLRAGGSHSSPTTGTTPEVRSRIPDPGAAQADRIEIQPLSVMRKKIAEHMILSRRTSAHVHSVFHVDFTTVEKIRQQKKAEYEGLGARLTYMAFIAKAVIDAIRRHPLINASLDGDNIVYKKDVNLGIAVALDGGLIVPVIRNADEKNILGLARAIADAANRARAKQLKPEEVQGGTFTITNPGQFGAQFGMPIINQPQVAILGVGTVEKRPVVIDDAIAIRTMAYLTLGYDHRLVDGAAADQFMADVKQQLEHFDAKQV
jgi:2-oxoglutarate dehydrogenase E2 component (dihydrolipoamide succinyltransferase)